MGDALSLLLVEDNPGDAVLVRALLGELSSRARLHHVHNMAEACDAIPALRPDAVLLDLNLPDSNGIASVAAVRERAPGVPIVVFTGLADEAIGVEAVRLGAQDYLVKGCVDGAAILRSVEYAVERKRIEEHLVATSQALAASNRALGAVARAVRVLLDVVDPAMTAEHVVRAAVETLDVKHACVWESQHDGTLKVVACRPPDASAACQRDNVARLAAQRRSVVLSSARDGLRSAAFPLMTPDRAIGVLQVSAPAALFESAAVVDGMSTYSSHAALAIRAAHLQEQFRQTQKMDAIGRLAGGIAHDFNNLVGAIIGYASVLQEDNPRPDQRVSLAAITTAARQAAALTRQLLAFSRRQVLQPRVINLNDVIQDMEDLLRKVVGARVRVVVSANAAAATARVDHGQIEQVVMHLVTNAAEAMPAGGVAVISTQVVDLERPRVAVEGLIEPGRYVEMSVTDTGAGMDAHTRRHAFEPFFTSKPLHMGAGLGLSTVLGIVQQSGGRVTVDSEPNRGTSVSVFLPWVAG